MAFNKIFMKRGFLNYLTFSGILFTNIIDPNKSIALILGITGMGSVFKAVYLDKLKLNCACIGGYAKTPLGIISFTENLLMSIMSVMILTK